MITIILIVYIHNINVNKGGKMKNLKSLLKWAIMPIFLLMILLIPNDNVKAVSDDSFYVTWMNNIYFTKFKDGVQRSERARLLRRSSDGQFVYCINQA